MHCNCLIQNNLRISRDGILMALDKMCHTLFTGVWCTTGWCQSTRLAESNQWLGGGVWLWIIHFPHKSNVIFFHFHTPGDGLNMFQIIFDFTCSWEGWFIDCSKWISIHSNSVETTNFTKAKFDDFQVTLFVPPFFRVVLEASCLKDLQGIG